MGTEELIARAEASLEGVTPGPWRYDRTNGSPTTGQHMIAGGLPGYLAEVRDCGSGDVFGNARFIAASRQLVSDLIAALRAERAARERAEAEREDAYVRGVAAGQAAMPKGTLTVIDSPEIAALRDCAELAGAMVAASYRDAANQVAMTMRHTTPADASAALARIRQEAEDKALELAAKVADEKAGSGSAAIARAIRALKGGAK